MRQTCFLFGHRDSPQIIQPEIEKAVEFHYQEYGIRQFYVGGYGELDRMAGSAVKAVKRKYGDVRLFLLIPYHPAERPVDVTEGFDGTFYPPLENTPRRYAIVKANRWMVENSDSIICWVTHFGNARNLLQYARKQEKRGLCYVENLGEENMYSAIPPVTGSMG